MPHRVVAWFSCGAASAVAAKLAIETYGSLVVPVYCDTSASEHPDNVRFMREVAAWLRSPITVLHSPTYRDIDDVFERTRYMAGVKGARCTVEMKKVPRFQFQEPDDTHVFGFTAEETGRITNFAANNPELDLFFPLQHFGVTKADCFARLTEAGIALPVMYGLGYRNNNCIGCVKATSARYWNMIRRDFPAVFDRRAEQSKRLGVRLTRMNSVRIFLDELPANYLGAEELENISCGPECGTQQGKS
jgi:3'-phosphoadenosine 5'-phosphosulfate sulfotransferase (PAPS reductase)/FAD synthetase